MVVKIRRIDPTSTLQRITATIETPSGHLGTVTTRGSAGCVDVPGLTFTPSARAGIVAAVLAEMIKREACAATPKADRAWLVRGRLGLVPAGYARPEPGVSREGHDGCSGN